MRRDPASGDNEEAVARLTGVNAFCTAAPFAARIPVDPDVGVIKIEKAEGDELLNKAE